MQENEQLHEQKPQTDEKQYLEQGHEREQGRDQKHYQEHEQTHEQEQDLQPGLDIDNQTVSLTQGLIVLILAAMIVGHLMLE